MRAANEEKARGSSRRSRRLPSAMRRANGRTAQSWRSPPPQSSTASRRNAVAADVEQAEQKAAMAVEARDEWSAASEAQESALASAMEVARRAGQGLGTRRPPGRRARDSSGRARPRGEECRAGRGDRTLAKKNGELVQACDAAIVRAEHAEAECAAMQQVVNELRSESREKESMRSEFMRRGAGTRRGARRGCRGTCPGRRAAARRGSGKGGGGGVLRPSMLPIRRLMHDEVSAAHRDGQQVMMVPSKQQAHVPTLRREAHGKAERYHASGKQEVATLT